jgi:hypothetical protein
MGEQSFPAIKRADLISESSPTQAGALGCLDFTP